MFVVPALFSTRRLFTEPNPTGLNTMLAMLGCVHPVFRLPYVPYDVQLRERGVEIMHELGLEYAAGKALTQLKDEDFITLQEW